MGTTCYPQPGEEMPPADEFGPEGHCAVCEKMDDDRVWVSGRLVCNRCVPEETVAERGVW